MRGCKALNAAFDCADESLRALLLRACRCFWPVELAALAAFFVVMMTRTLAQLAGASAASCALAVLVLCLPLAAMLDFGLRIARERGESLMSMLGVCVLCGAAMLARVSFIERSSGDYDIYLADWLAKLASGSFSEGMKANIGEYNVLYQYILFLITRLKVPALYAVKAVSFIGDAFLAAAAARLARKDGKDSMIAFGIVLLLPTIVLNGGMYAQCDSLYAACALWGLALSLDGKPVRSAVCFALSLSFKLQSAFILPVVAVLWVHRKLKLRDAFVFVAALFAVMLPALLGGKGMMDIIRIYTVQTGLYTGLTYNAASFFGLINTTGLDVYAYGNFGMALAFGACALMVLAGIAMGEKAQRSDYVRLALCMVLLIVFFLPRMHERYFYMVLPLAAALAARRRGLAAAALVLAETAMLATLWETAITLQTASLMMLAAVTAVLADGKEMFNSREV